jgi:hypothetical protein
MTSQNEEVRIDDIYSHKIRKMSFFVKAEELMRKIEREEDKLPFETPEKKVFHLCIVNLVIG